MILHLEIVARYYDAWQNKHGNFSAVPLSDDFEFTGPVASFDSADGFERWPRGGPAVTSFEVRRQFVGGEHRLFDRRLGDGDPGVGRMTAAELLEVVDGEIVRGELIYDAEALRQAMAQSTA